MSVQKRAVYGEPRTIAKAVCPDDATTPCDPASIAAALAPVLDLPASELQEKLSSTKTAFVYLARDLSTDKGARGARAAAARRRRAVRGAPHAPGAGPRGQRHRLHRRRGPRARRHRVGLGVHARRQGRQAGRRRRQERPDDPERREVRGRPGARAATCSSRSTATCSGTPRTCWRRRSRRRRPRTAASSSWTAAAARSWRWPPHRPSTPTAARACRRRGWATRR